jgi:polyhydroxyalkanoate synthase subunit PhaC
MAVHPVPAQTRRRRPSKAAAREAVDSLPSRSARGSRPRGRDTAEPAAADPGVGEDNADVAAPLDALLVDAAFSPLRRFNPGIAGLRLGASVVAHPQVVARPLAATATELLKVAVGASAVAPPAKDRRFTDPAWQHNPLLHRLLQAYLVTGGMAKDVVGESHLEWKDRERLAFVTDNVVEALSPSNNPALNPAALKAALDTGGANFVRGAWNLASDMAVKPRVPSMVDTSAFAVGRDLAVTPGAVVLRTDVFELIQYAPHTPRVRAIPLLVVPPTINKYYIADLAPGRSMVEHFVASGQQVFMVSWRNPGPEHADWNLDTYAQAVLDALAAVEDICHARKTVLFSLCSGGIISTLTLGHLIATGQEHRLAGFSLGVTLLDQSHAGLVSALTSPQVAAAAAARSRAQGYLDGRSLAEVFAWLRPGDLVWNYWVNNYLLGKKPPAFDVLYWNADTTRMAAGLHADFLDLAMSNGLTRPGGSSVLGTPVDVSKATVDSYIVAGIADHICPWTSCYRSAQILGGASRFVLSTSGHIAALVNPPGNPKSSFRVSDEPPNDAQNFLRDVQPTQGSWWSDYVTWLASHSGPEKRAPKTLGNGAHPVLAEAPGTYVFAS